MSPFSAASIAPASAVSSHGCATAVGTGSRLRHLTSSCSYFPVPDVRSMVSSHSAFDPRPNRGPGFSQEKGQDDRDTDADEQRRERRLIVLELHRRDAG